MPKHITESTGASIAAEHQFTTGKLLIDPTAEFHLDQIYERTSGTGVTIDGVWLKDGNIELVNATLTGILSLSSGTSIAISSGGTGATTVAGAKTSLGFVSGGANSDITSLSGLTTPLSVAQGGTGTTYTTEYVTVICVAPSTDVTIVSDVARFEIPFAGYVASAFAGVSTASTGVGIVVDCWINNSSVFTTKLSIDAGETKSSTAGTPSVISTGTSPFAQWDVFRVHVDQTSTATSAEGLSVNLTVVKV